MRNILFALCLLLCGVAEVQADTLRWYDCKKEMRYLTYVPSNEKALLEKVVDPKRVTECTRVKIKERTMMIAALEPLAGARPFPKETLTSQLQEVAGKRYVVVDDPLRSLKATVYRGIARHSLHRRPTFVSSLSVIKDKAPHRLLMTFYGNEVENHEIEDAFQLLVNKFSLSCELPLCRRP